MKYYRLTYPDKKFADKIAEDINKDYPGEAKVENDCCLITESYWEYCRDYVQANCKIKS